MRIVVLAASGRTGQEITSQALARGHHVTTLTRTPRPAPPDDRVREVLTDLADPQRLTEAIEDADAVVSGLGRVEGSPADLLASAATALVQARGASRADLRVVWLGAYGTGVSAAAAGPTTRLILKLAIGKEIPDKVRADSLLLAAGATVMHAGPLTTGPLSTGYRTVPLEDTPRRFLPRTVSRATVAAAMLDVAESGVRGHGGRVLLPLP